MGRISVLIIMGFLSFLFLLPSLYFLLWVRLWRIF